MPHSPPANFMALMLDLCGQRCNNVALDHTDTFKEVIIGQGKLSPQEY